MTTPAASPSPPARRHWITRTILGIVLATFFSDVSHEMATAVLPFYLASIGLGPAALGMIEGAADFFVSFAKLGGGYLGHRVRRKKPWAALGYLVTCLATAGIGLAHTAVAIVSLRTSAWIGRGFRSPLRDYMLADEVEATHYGRAYGLERTGDMLGAVLGPLIAAGAIALGLSFGNLILWTLVPGLLAAGSMLFIVRDRLNGVAPAQPTPNQPRTSVRLPRAFWQFLAVVMLFGMGDFSRTFLIWIAAKSLGLDLAADGVISMSVLLYAGHNIIAALAAYPAGHLGDRRSKRGVLLVGYAIGVLVNGLLMAGSGSIAVVVVAVILSGVYISIQETIEKAVVAETLSREQRSLGLGVLACGNAVGNMASSLYVGLLLEAGRASSAFGIAAAFSTAGAVALLMLQRQRAAPQSQ